ncbi:hypothetical protein GQ43DRAFT_443428 [Delitschia confertaspora ATCC 74209]|uniref:FAR1 domain-containing protein n=1 Tax=Delitschia confertaspora ATCC 74209 TaxID=1513339 RepID=A0A9P4JHZ4_9PLEO|nr:hypothetical protein GQ43DRAFT_443428 [Delitschia confertaspora ATCC 74209]
MPRPLPNNTHDLDVPIYGSLPAELSNADTYQAYAGNSHHDSSAIDHLSGSFNNNLSTALNQSLSPSIHHNVPQTHGNNTTLHLDPNLDPNAHSLPHHDQDLSPPSLSDHLHQFPSRSTVNHGPPSPAEDEGPPTPPTPPQIPNSAPEGEFDMMPPPFSMHPSFTALHAYAQSHAAAHGYALSINTTAKNRSRIKLACVCYGRPKNTHKLTPETRIRKNRVSAKTGCRMWVEGKRQDNGLWRLRVGIGEHNHPGRDMDSWAVQRKRTWGVQSGRVGLGGVTAREERERLAREAQALDSQQHQIDANDNGVGDARGADLDGVVPQESTYPQDATPTNEFPQLNYPPHSLESGGLVWRIVEQEMLRKGGSGKGRDRGVGRTVQVLQERLPGIRIFKRDVYNIRAQIKRARKKAGQEIGEGLENDDESEMIDQQNFNETNNGAQDQQHHIHDGSGNPGHHNFGPEIDPLLVQQCDEALRNVSQQQHQHQQQQQQQQQQQTNAEVERLRQEVEMLRRELDFKNKLLQDRDMENQRLRVDLEVAKLDAIAQPMGQPMGQAVGQSMGMYNPRGGPSEV